MRRDDEGAGRRAPDPTETKARDLAGIPQASRPAARVEPAQPEVFNFRFSTDGEFKRKLERLAEVEELASQVDGYSVDYVGLTLNLDGVAVQSVSGDPATFADCVKAVRAKTKRALILLAEDPEVRADLEKKYDSQRTRRGSDFVGLSMYILFCAGCLGLVAVVAAGELGL